MSSLLPSPANASIRVLGPADLAAMRGVLETYGEAFNERATYVDKQPDDAYLADLLGSPNFVTVAAFLGPTVVGALSGYVLPKFEQARSELYIYDLAVRDGHRRRGIATAMIAELRRFALARGIHAVFVQADHGDDPAVALYTKLGVREEVLHFDLHLHAPAS